MREAWAVACAVGILIFACVQLPARDKKPIHYRMAATCFVLDYVLLYFTASETGLIRHFPALIGSDIAATFLVAPLLYLTSLSVLHEGRPPARRYAVYFVVPALFAVCTEIYNALTARGYLDRFGALPGHFSSPMLIFLTLCADLLLTATIILCLFCRAAPA